MLEHSQGIGQAFEDAVMWEAKASGIYVIKQHPETVFVAKGQGRVTGKAWVDFIGIYKGLAFTFDAKTTINKRSWKPPKKFEHQYWNMKDASPHMPCFYLIEWRYYGQVELFLVRPYSPYPFYCRYGQGNYKVNSLSSGWFGAIIETAFRFYDGGYDGISD